MKIKANAQIHLRNTNKDPEGSDPKGSVLKEEGTLMPKTFLLRLEHSFFPALI